MWEVPDTAAECAEDEGLAAASKLGLVFVFAAHTCGV